MIVPPVGAKEPPGVGIDQCCTPATPLKKEKKDYASLLFQAVHRGEKMRDENQTDRTEKQRIAAAPSGCLLLA